MSSNVLKNVKWIFKSIIQYLLRPVTLNAILFLFVVFIIGEITAITNTEDIEKFCDYLQNKYTGDIAFFITSFIRIFYTNGDWTIVLLSIIASAPFIFLRYIELSEQNIKFNSGLIVLVGILLTMCLSIYFISRTELKQNPELLIDGYYPGSKTVSESFRFENVEYKLYDNGVFNLIGKQTNNRFDDWEGYMNLTLIDGNNNTLKSFNTKKFFCKAKGVSGGKVVNSIVFDTIIPFTKIDETIQIKIKEISYEKK